MWFCVLLVEWETTLCKSGLDHLILNWNITLMIKKMICFWCLKHVLYTRVRDKAGNKLQTWFSWRKTIMQPLLQLCVCSGRLWLFCVVYNWKRQPTWGSSSLLFINELMASRKDERWHTAASQLWSKADITCCQLM